MSTHRLAPEKQKNELDRIFESWKGEMEQTDDVLIAGIKFV